MECVNATDDAFECRCLPGFTGLRCDISESVNPLSRIFLLPPRKIVFIGVYTDSAEAIRRVRHLPYHLFSKIGHAYFPGRDGTIPENLGT